MLNTRTCVLAWDVNESQRILIVFAVSEGDAHDVLLCFVDIGHSTRRVIVPAYSENPVDNHSQMSLRSSVLFF